MLTASCMAGSAAKHSGTEGFDERGTGRYQTSNSTERRRSLTGQDEERGIQVSAVRGLQVSIRMFDLTYIVQLQVCEMCCKTATTVRFCMYLMWDLY